jgi:hypothetical protein
MNPWENIASLAKNYFATFYQELTISDKLNFEKSLNEIDESIRLNGSWQHSEEWRISTYTHLKIEKTQHDNKNEFQVTVSSDNQTHSFICPDLERALFYCKLFEHIISYTFYSVGPPWAATK